MIFATLKSVKLELFIIPIIIRFKRGRIRI